MTPDRRTDPASYPPGTQSPSSVVLKIDNVSLESREKREIQQQQQQQQNNNQNNKRKEEEKETEEEKKRTTKNKNEETKFKYN